MLQEQKLTGRNSSIELLRIITMIMIVACHFATHGGFSFDVNCLSVPRLWWNFIELGGNLGTDVFVLISGYFLVTSNGRIFNVNRILKFWWQVFTYSMAVYCIFSILGVCDFELVSCIKAMFPIASGSWWFASTYFVLYLIHPFINMLLQRLDKRTYQILIATQLVLWCVIPSLTPSNCESNSLVWFVTLYCVAGYVRLFGLNPRFTAKSYLGFWLLFSALRYLSCIILIALSLFMAFEKYNMGYVKWINLVASAAFGVYLIHDNDIIKPLLWHEVFQNAKYQDSILIIPYSIIVVLIVYVVCTLIDLLRQCIIEKPFMIFVNRYSEKIVRQVKADLAFLLDIFN